MRERREYTIDEKIEAAVAWLVTGSAEEAGRLCSMPSRTIRYWMQQEWWEDLLREAQGRKQKELDAVWTGLIHRIATELRDRVDNGDSVISRNGAIVKVPVRAKDLSLVMGIAVDKRALARGQATSRTEKVSIDERINKLANKLEATGKVVNEFTG